MKLGDKVDVFVEGAEFEAEVIGINDENGTIAVKDAKGIRYDYLPPFVKGTGSIRHYVAKTAKAAPVSAAPVRKD